MSQTQTEGGIAIDYKVVGDLVAELGPEFLLRSGQYVIFFSKCSCQDDDNDLLGIGGTGVSHPNNRRFQKTQGFSAKRRFVGYSRRVLRKKSSPRMSIISIQSSIDPACITVTTSSGILRMASSGVWVKSHSARRRSRIISLVAIGARD